MTEAEQKDDPRPFQLAHIKNCRRPEVQQTPIKNSAEIVCCGLIKLKFLARTS